MTQTTPTYYSLTLINPDGTRIAELPVVPCNPRYVHLYDDDNSIELSDNPEPDRNTTHSTTFTRIVALHVDDDRYALLVRTI